MKHRSSTTHCANMFVEVVPEEAPQVGWQKPKGPRVVMLHCFVKKSEPTPLRERQVAEARMKDKRANP